MFSTLLASRPTVTRSTSGYVLSLALHGTILTAAIVSGMRQPPAYDAPRETRVVPLVPFSRVVTSSPPAAVARPATPIAPVNDAPKLPALEVPTEVPSSIPEPNGEPWVPALELPAGNPTPLSGTPGAVASPTPNSAGTALGAGDVQQPAALRSNSPLPRYPDLLRAQRLEGRAVARFVVGTDGRVDPATLTFVESTHPAFEAAVRAALPRLRFTPGRVERRAVRQWVELPFGFRLEPR
jgi:protein TonB